METIFLCIYVYEYIDRDIYMNYTQESFSLNISLSSLIYFYLYLHI